jgi:hypothetical protein
MAKKFVPINYTARDFNTIKKELLEYTKRYYPDSFQDFSDSSFGSLMIDTVSYVGDVLSFYLDYQANESFLETSLEYDNVIKLARQMGYKFDGVPTTYGSISLYISIPVTLQAGVAPDRAYMPVIKAGSQFRATNGSYFTLVEDININDPRNEIVVASVDSTTGLPTRYAVKATGAVVSGLITRKQITVGDFTRFLKVELDDVNVSEVLSVVDTEGNEYYQVDFLSQDVVYKDVIYPNQNDQNIKSLLKPFSAARRFVVEKTRTTTNLMFGYGSENEISENVVVDPAQYVLQVHGKNYSSETAFDPTNLIKTDKFGVSPSNTTLTVTYRKSNVNASVSTNSITRATQLQYSFDNQESLLQIELSNIINSIEVTNEEPIVGNSNLPTLEELKTRIANNFATQNRAVTKQDYVSFVYNMPSKYGSIKRCAIYQDADSFKRNLNLYVISMDQNGNLAQTNSVAKENIKSWLNSNRMINDSIDILDATVINLGIDFLVQADPDVDKIEVLNNCLLKLRLEYSSKFDIAEPFNISRIYNILNSVKGVTDTINVSVSRKFGGLYSSFSYNVEKNTTNDGRFINIPKDHIFEIKFPSSDITGRIR